MTCCKRESLHVVTELRRGDKDTCAVPRGTFAKVSEKYKVKVTTVSNIWNEYCGQVGASKVDLRGRPKKLSVDDIHFVEYKKM